MTDVRVGSSSPTDSGGERARRDARREILADLHPVRPLAPPWKRASWAIVPWAFVGAIFVWVGAGLRPDLGALGPLAGFGFSGVLLVAAWAMAWLLARESVPGRLTPASAVVASLGLVVGARLAVATLVHVSAPSPVEDGQELRLAFVCGGATAALALPAFCALAVLARRGLVMRPILAAWVGGAAAAVGAEALWRLHCPFTDVSHALAGHLSPVVALAAVWLVVAVAGRRRESS